MTNTKHCALETLHPVKSYLRWCAKSPEGQELQRIWRRPMWQDSHPDTYKGLTSLTNINMGDRVMHGSNNYEAYTPQVSVIVSKILYIGALTHKGNHYEYRIDCNIGGHHGAMTHDAVTDGYWIWIPWFEQLVTMGTDVEQAIQLVLGWKSGDTTND